MINLSRAFRQELFYNRRNYLTYADITLSTGRTLSLTNTQIWSGGFSTEDAVSEDNSFTALGSTIMGAATLVINNMTEAYSNYDFTNAKVVLYVGMTFKVNGSTRTEKIKKGTYTVDETSYNGGTITLSLLDYMEQFDRPYSNSTLSYPNTLDAIVRDACNKCGVSLNTYTFPHRDYVVQNRPEDEAITFREVIGWAACIAGCFARCNVDGKLELKWFDQTTLESRTNVIDGGRSFSSSGTLIDGGGFDTDYDVIDGGNLADDDGMHYVHSLYSQDISVDDVVITGVHITVKDETEEGKSSTKEFNSGRKGYVIGIENNDFITPETGQEVANWLGEQLIGLTFRKASVTHASDPSMEAGDIGILWDRKDNEYPVLITRTNFSATASQKTVSGAETPSRNSATRYGWQTKSYVESRKLLKKEQTTREAMLKDLADKLAAHSGLYSTVETQSDGSSIFYLHDMPTLNESAIVWKMTKEAWGVTTNYNKGKNTVWNGGMTVDGDTIVRILTAVGVDADWINTGKIQSKDGSVSIDLDKNTINLKGITSFDGFETKDNLKTAGKTTINGANITTGSIKDANSNTVFNLSTGSLTMKKGSIELGTRFKVDSNGYLTAESVDLKGHFRSVSGSTFTEIYNGQFRAGTTNGSYDTLHGVIDADANYGGGIHAVSVIAKTGFLVLGGNGTIWFTDQTGSGNAWGWANSNGLHSKGGLSVSSIAIPTAFDSEGKAVSWYTGYIDDGIIK